MTTQTYSLYGGEIDVQFLESVHRYKVNGEFKSSVTTVLQCLSKENLIQWSATQAVETFRLAYTDKGWTKEQFTQLCNEAKYAHRNKKDAAGDVGTRVHNWISHYIKGEATEPMNDAIYPSVQAFLEWEKQAQPFYIDSERVVYSKAHDYCGTVDLVMQIDGKRGIWDLKTGKPEQEFKKGYTGRQRARETHFLQDGAYDQAIGEEDGIFADELGVIYLPLDGSIHVYQNDNPEFWREGFIKVLETFRFLKSAGQVNEFQAA